MPKSTQKITLSQSRDIPFNCLVSNVRRIEAGVSIDCLDIDVKSVVFGGHPPGLIETAIAKAVDERHRRWSEQLPQEPGDLWEALLACDTDSRHALFAIASRAVSTQCIIGVRAHSVMPIASRKPSTSTSRAPGGRQLSQPCDESSYSASGA